MIQLEKDVLNGEMLSTDIFKNIVMLVKTYQWNNFLQLKVNNMFNIIIDTYKSDEFRGKFLEASGIGPALVEMSE